MISGLECASCQTDGLVKLAENLSNGRKRLRCARCGSEWIRGEALKPQSRLPTLAEIKARFPQPGDVEPAALARAQELKARFLTDVSDPDARVAPHWGKYQDAFSTDGLLRVDPQVLKDFANSNIGANPGNMSVFNDAWNEIGPDGAASEVQQMIECLLRGPSTIPLEERLTQLIDGTKSSGIRGFKEALLTKVLCVMRPERYLTILNYTGTAGKREIARSIRGLELPDPENVPGRIGRLVIGSNDLLLALIGDGFETQQHAAEFLWWAKDPGR
jgi:hypothetical protein